MRVLLDVNVILDAMLQRHPWHQDADAIIKAHGLRQLDGIVTTLSLATVFYVSRKAIGTASARSSVKKCLATFEVLSIDKQTLLDADAQPGADFEDNIIIAAAISVALDAIITRNPADFAHSPVPVWQPAELLRRLSSSSTSIGGTPPNLP